jgi:hypothetical protein
MANKKTNKQRDNVKWLIGSKVVYKYELDIEELIVKLNIKNAFKANEKCYGR